MRRLWFILGILTCIASAFPMLAQTIAPDLAAPFASIVCRPGERLTGQVLTTTSVNRTRVSTSFTCVNAAGAERSVTGEVVQIATVWFLGLFFLGLGFLGMQMVLYARSLPANRQHITANPARSTAPSSLTERLQELKESRRKGLITEDEYHQMRQKTIEKWG
jgi:hypothetical protein